MVERYHALENKLAAAEDMLRARTASRGATAAAVSASGSAAAAGLATPASHDAATELRAEEYEDVKRQLSAAKERGMERARTLRERTAALEELRSELICARATLRKEAALRESAASDRDGLLARVAEHREAHAACESRGVALQVRCNVELLRPQTTVTLYYVRILLTIEITD